jgi:hypothetical protein
MPEDWARRAKRHGLSYPMDANVYRLVLMRCLLPYAANMIAA